jgi:hypothetical protein
MATEPNQAAIDAGAPTITLAGKAWPIPMLAVRQNRLVVPAVRVWAKDAAGVFDSTPAYDNALSAIFNALLRAHPDITRAEFDELEITAPEVNGSFVVIAIATGLFTERGEPSGPSQGEAPAAQ